jgi:hypothetical protein
MALATRMAPQRLSPALLIGSAQDKSAHEGEASSCASSWGDWSAAAVPKSNLRKSIVEARASIDRLSLHGCGGGGGGEEGGGRGGGGRRDRRSSLGPMHQGLCGAGAGEGVREGEGRCTEGGNAAMGGEGVVGGMVRPQFGAVLGSWLRAKDILVQLVLTGAGGAGDGGARGQGVADMEERGGGGLCGSDGRGDGVRQGGKAEESNRLGHLAHVEEEEAAEESAHEQEERLRVLKDALLQLPYRLAQLKTIYSSFSSSSGSTSAKSAPAAAQA